MTMRINQTLGRWIRYLEWGGSPGLVVMGVDSRSKGRGFESQRRILDGHFFTLICCKNCIVCLKRPKINKKEAGVGPNLKKRYLEWVTEVDWSNNRKLCEYTQIHGLFQFPTFSNFRNSQIGKSIHTTFTDKEVI